MKKKCETCGWPIVFSAILKLWIEPAGETFKCGFGDKLHEPREDKDCLLYTSPSPRDATLSRMPSSA